MLAAFTLILVCQIAGEALVRGAGLPLPGPVIGMLLLFLLMRLRLPLPQELNDAADVLLKYLALLFVPAGVGAVQHLNRLGSSGWCTTAKITRRAFAPSRKSANPRSKASDRFIGQARSCQSSVMSRSRISGTHTARSA